MAVELQIIPSTGVTLPFFSYGGTAQVTLLAAMGFILCVSRCTIPQEEKEELIEEEIPEAAPRMEPAVSTVSAAPVSARSGRANHRPQERIQGKDPAGRKIKR